jgi:hypothetical protein
MILMGKMTYSKDNPPACATLSTTNPTWTGLKSSPGLCVDRSVTANPSEPDVVLRKVPQIIQYLQPHISGALEPFKHPEVPTVFLKKYPS